MIVKMNYGKTNGMVAVIEERDGAFHLWWSDGPNDWEESYPSLPLAICGLAALTHTAVANEGGKEWRLLSPVDEIVEAGRAFLVGATFPDGQE
jgi:hypothetical protein